MRAENFRVLRRKPVQVCTFPMLVSIGRKVIMYVCLLTGISFDQEHFVIMRKELREVMLNFDDSELTLLFYYDEIPKN